MVALLVTARLAAPLIVTKVVRASLADMGGGYHGDIAGSELSLLSGEVHLLDLTVRKTNGQVPVPFMKIPRFVLGVTWDGFKPRTTLTAVDAQLNWVDAHNEAQQQWGPKFDPAQLRRQLPFELGRVQFIDGEAHFRNFEARPAIDVYVNHLDATWGDLTGCLPPGGSACDSSFELDGRVMKGAKLHAEGSFDRHHGPDLVARAKLHELAPRELNPLLLRYAELDVEHGTIDLSARYRAQGATQRLVVIPALNEVEIVGSDQAKTSLFRELAAGAAAGFFERHKGGKAIAYRATKGSSDWSLVDVSETKGDVKAM